MGLSLVAAVASVAVKRVFFFLLFFLSFIPHISAQALTSGADFLKIDSGARSQGMGGAFTAVADDVTALTWNPAGLALLEHPQVGYLRMLYLSDIAYNFGGAALPLPMGEDTLGLGIGVINLGASFDSTNGLQPAVSAGENAFLLSFAYRVKGLVAFGLTAKYILRDLGGYSASAIGGDLGILATLPDLPLRIGAGVFHLGQSVQFVNEADPLPLSGRLGLAYEVLRDEKNSLLLAMDHAYQFEAGLWEGAIGAEYWYDSTLGLRAGYTGNTDLNHFTAGVGVNLGIAELDYAYAPIGSVGDTHRISLLFRIGADGVAAPAVGAFGPPADFSARAMDASATLSWKNSSSKDVVGYHLYVKKPGAADYVRLTRRPIHDTSATLKKLENGATYGFAVASVSAAGRESRMAMLTVRPEAAGAGGGEPSTAPVLAPPSGFKAQALGEGFQLTWNGAEGAAGYNLYMVNSAGDVLKKLSAKPLKETQVAIKKASADSTYRFTVTSVGADGKESLPSGILEVTPGQLEGSSLEGLLPPKLAATAGDGSAKLSWGAAKGASGYHLYRSENGRNFTRMTKEPLAVYRVTLKGLVNGRTYWFAATSVSPSGEESDKEVVRVNPTSETGPLDSLPKSKFGR